MESGPRDLFLAWVTLALLYAATYARLTRATMLETLGEDYVRTARAKGLRERVVLGKHAMRSVMTPIVTVFGLDLGGLLGGAILTEQVFSLPGLGKLARRCDRPTRPADHSRCDDVRRVLHRRRPTSSWTCSTRVIDPRVRLS